MGDVFDTNIATGRARGLDGLNPRQFGKNLHQNLLTIRSQLRNGTYRFQNYKLQLKSKGQRKHPREISVPCVRDRIVLRAMTTTLHAVFPYTQTELAPEKIARLVVALHSGRFVNYVRIDIKDFYGSCDVTVGRFGAP